MMRVQSIDGTTIHSDNDIRIGTSIHGKGTITRTFNHPDDGPILPDKTMCQGCRDDFYNGHGAQECWAFKTATVVNKVGYATLNVMNGPNVKMVKTLSCWYAVRR